MKERFFAGLVILMLIVAEAAVSQQAQQAQQSQQGQEDIKALAGGVQSLAGGLKTEAQQRQALAKDITKLRTEMVKPASSTRGGAVVQAQKTANRALAWAIWPLVVDANGQSPDIEEVEKMLSPLENGDMSPLAFEKALAEALKAKGWKVIVNQAKTGTGTGISEERLREIVREILKEEREEAKKSVAAGDSSKSLQPPKTSVGTEIDVQKIIERLREAGYKPESEIRPIIADEISKQLGENVDLEEIEKDIKSKASQDEVNTLKKKVEEQDKWVEVNSRAIARVTKRKDKTSFFSYVKDLSQYNLKMKKPFFLQELGYDNLKEALKDISKNTGLSEGRVQDILNLQYKEQEE